MHLPIRRLRGAALLVAGSLTALVSADAQTTPSTTAADAPVTPFAPKAPAAVSLKDAYRGIFNIGAALNRGQFSGTNAQGAALVAREFNSVTAENAMKWAHDADPWRRNSSPLIFDDNYGRKPAYDGVIHALTLAAAAR